MNTFGVLNEKIGTLISKILCGENARYEKKKEKEKWVKSKLKEEKRKKRKTD